MSRTKTEEEIKVAFHEDFSDDYIDYLSRKADTSDLVEILWLGFSHGYMKRQRDMEG